jgi:hypothetical protein
MIILTDTLKNHVSRGGFWSVVQASRLPDWAVGRASRLPDGSRMLPPLRCGDGALCAPPAKRDARPAPAKPHDGGPFAFSVPRYFEWISHRAAVKRRQRLTFSAPKGRQRRCSAPEGCQAPVSADFAPPGLATAAPRLHRLIEKWRRSSFFQNRNFFVHINGILK